MPSIIAFKEITQKQTDRISKVQLSNALAPLASTLESFLVSSHKAHRKEMDQKLKVRTTVVKVASEVFEAFEASGTFMVGITKAWGSSLEAGSLASLASSMGTSSLATCIAVGVASSSLEATKEECTTSLAWDITAKAYFAEVASYMAQVQKDFPPLSGISVYVQVVHKRHLHLSLKVCRRIFHAFLKYLPTLADLETLA